MRGTSNRCGRCSKANKGRADPARALPRPSLSDGYDLGRRRERLYPEVRINLAREVAGALGNPNRPRLERLKVPRWSCGDEEEIVYLALTNRAHILILADILLRAACRTPHDLWVGVIGALKHTTPREH